MDRKLHRTLFLNIILAFFLVSNSSVVLIDKELEILPDLISLPGSLRENSSYWSSGGPFGGAVNYILPDPNNGEIYYISTSYGGTVYKTTDGGFSWFQLESGLETINSISSFAITSDGSALFLAADGNGIYKSTNYGDVWTKLPIGNGSYIDFIAIDPQNSKRVLFAYYDGLYVTNDGGDNWGKIFTAIENIRVIAIDPNNSQVIYIGTDGAGIFKSMDGGQSWNPKNIGIEAQGIISSISIDSTNSLNIFIGATEYVTQSGVFKSTNGGDSWQPTPLFGNYWDYRYAKTAIDPKDHLSIYANRPEDIMKSIDGGATWSWMASGLTSGVSTFAFSSGENQHILVGGRGVHKTINNGSKWLRTSDGILNAEVKRISISPSNSSILYAATWGDGLFKSTDNGNSWDRLDTLSDCCFHTIGIDPYNPQKIYASNMKSIDGGQTWYYMDSHVDSSGDYAFDPNNTDIIYSANEWGSGEIYKSLDGGYTWTPITFQQDAIGDEARIAINPIDSSNLFLSVNGQNLGIFKSIDYGNTWTKVLNLHGAYAVQIDHKNVDVVFACASSGVYKSIDGGSNWTQINNQRCFDLIINPNETSYLYANFDSYGLLQSKDGGTTWLPMDIAGLPNYYNYSSDHNRLSIDNQGRFLFLTTFSHSAWRYPLPIPFEINISHMEVTQATQSTSNGTPLIAGKPTFVRVYVDCTVNCNNVTGVLHGYGPGGELASSPRTPNFSINAEHEQDWTKQRGDLNKTLNFSLPTQWTTGTVTLTIEIAEKQLSEEVTFQQRKQINVISVPIRYNNHAPDLSRIHQGFTWALHVYPTHRINYVSGTTIQWDHYLNLDRENVLPLLNDLTTRYRLLNDVYVFGWLPEGTLNGGTSDPRFSGGTGRTAVGDDNPTEGQRIFAHEIGHLLGRRHTNTINACGNVPVDPDTDWNFPNSNIQEWGLDGHGFGWLVSSSTPIKNPAFTFDYMSYCGSLSDFNVWTSSWTYERIYDALLLDSNSLEVQTLATPAPYFISSGLVFTDDTATLDPIFVITANTPSDNPAMGTQYCLEAQNESGVSLTSYCFDLSFTDYETGESINVDGFNLMLPYPTGVSRIVLKKGDQELAVRTISANFPVVNILAPSGGELWSTKDTYDINWTATDIDNDLLSFNISYSPDGNNWIPVGATSTETQITVNSAELPGGDNAYIRVIATDGLNTTTVDSASFIVGRKEPQAVILSPDKDGTIYPNTQLFLQGYAFDAEDGMLEDSALQWSSDRDGSLGTGSIVLASLSLGQHFITLTAIDSNGNETTVSINIYVGNKIFLPLIRR